MSRLAKSSNLIYPDGAKSHLPPSEACAGSFVASRRLGGLNLSQGEESFSKAFASKHHFSKAVQKWLKWAVCTWMHMGSCVFVCWGTDCVVYLRCFLVLGIAPQQNWEDISDFSYHGVRGWSGCWVGHLRDLEPDGFKCPTPGWVSSPRCVAWKRAMTSWFKMWPPCNFLL